MPPPSEAFLAYLWQFQQFDTAALRTEAGEAIGVLHVGQPNTHAGADFQNARLLIGDVEWAGAVELHRRASDWFAHRHEHNAAYENVILHVVWQADVPVRRHDGTELPALALATRTDPALVHRYEALMQARAPIPCAAQFGRVSTLTRLSMLDRALMQRLQTKAGHIVARLQATQQDWEETAWQTLARAFGFGLNAEPMQQLAQALPLKILQKHRGNLLQLEALLFGVAGLLAPADAPAEAKDYARMLEKEYQFLAAKYALPADGLGRSAWKFLRLRPANFPTVRLAQLAQVLDQQPSLFALLVQTESPEVLRNALNVSQSAYWQAHYVWGKTAAKPVPPLGPVALSGILINAAVPLLVAYARERDQPAAFERALALLDSLPAEKNSVTALYQHLGQAVRTASDSQGILEWHQTWCGPKHCLRCTVGVALVRSGA